MGMLILSLFVRTLWFLLVAHVLCDIQLQGDLSRMKNHTLNPRSAGGFPWQIALLAHGAIHGTAVYLITGSFALCLTETFAHALIDYLKNCGKFSIKVDQIMHALLKVLYAATVASLAYIAVG